MKTLREWWADIFSDEINAKPEVWPKHDVVGRYSVQVPVPRGGKARDPFARPAPPIQPHPELDHIVERGYRSEDLVNEDADGTVKTYDEHAAWLRQKMHSYAEQMDLRPIPIRMGGYDGEILVPLRAMFASMMGEMALFNLDYWAQFAVRPHAPADARHHQVLVERGLA